MTDKPRVLIVQPNMQPPGGGPGVSAWATMALQDEYALDVVTWVPIQADQINRFFGTALDLSRFRNLYPPQWLNMLYDLDPDPWSYQKLAFLSRSVKLMRQRYAAVISFCDEVDLGAPAIQYIHFPYMGSLYHQECTLAQQSRWRTLLLQLRPWRLVSGFAFERMRNNVSLVNSDWTGRLFANAYDRPWRKVYPPVTGNFPQVSWAEREIGFVAIGRFSADKRFEDMVEILGQVRARGYPVRLHIIGSSMKRKYDLAYTAVVYELVKSHSEWVTLHEDIPRDELEQLVARQRYGLHALRREHFGMAPAEMVRAGCIVFVFNDGGQVEIVGNEERLRYNSNVDAVEKISAVLADECAQTQLCTALAARAQLYTPERFMGEIRSVVAETIARRR